MKREKKKDQKKDKKIYGVGYNDMPRGWVSESPENYKIYNTWRHMLLRTTEKWQRKYPTYQGITCCDDWLYLSNFAEDVKRLNNYEAWLKNEETYLLDKDVLGNGNKVYSKETCCFLNYTESNRDVISRNPENLTKLHQGGKEYGMRRAKPVKATHSKTNEVLYFESIRECARQLNVVQANIQCCLSDNPKYASNKTVKKYKLEFITPEEYENITKTIAK